MNRLVYIAPDGARVSEGLYPSVSDCWQRCDDMGSRWFFYPLPVVVGGGSNLDRARIVDVHSYELDHWKGRTLRSLCLAVAENEADVCDWLNGEAACPL